MSGCRCFLLATIWFVNFSVVCTQPVWAQEDTLPFKMLDGFSINQFANDSQAHDVLCMTVDAYDRVIVSGPGYLRALVDTDGDGKADRSDLLANYPKDGAQGLAVDGDDLLVVGDGGLWRWPGLVGKQRSSAPAVKLLSFPTGAEHAVHSIQRGPDGSWYLIAGNFSKGIEKLLESTSPNQRQPRAGTIWRFDSKFQQRELYCEGLRNAYDFTFLPDGSIVSYDSDDERDVTLPFYRPTRILRLHPGSDAGWVSSGWKDSDDTISMPEIIALTGRGSPTGVACYQHQQWPSEYYGAILAADWTFGRIWIASRGATPSQPGTETAITERFQGFPGWKLQSLVEATGDIGFAPTDMAVTPDGSLLISAGGRGTQGAIYRVTWNDAKPVAAVDPGNSLDLILSAPQPRDGWSRARWLRSAQGVEVKSILAEIDRAFSRENELNSSDFQRIQLAAEILLHRQQPLPLSLFKRMVESKQEQLQQIAWWWLGRDRSPLTAEWGRYLLERSKLGLPIASGDNGAPQNEVARTILEAHGFRARELRKIGAAPTWSINGDQFAKLDRSTVQVALWSIARNDAYRQNLIRFEQWPQGAPLLGGIARLMYQRNASSVDLELIGLVEKSYSALPDSLLARQIWNESIRKSLGDYRYQVPLQTNPQDSNVFDGYRALHAQRLVAAQRSNLVSNLLAMEKKAADQGDQNFSAELLRTAAMLQVAAPPVVDRALEAITDQSEPSDDLHHVLVIARIPSPRTAKQSEGIAASLLGIVRKVQQKNLTTDRNWPSRLDEISVELQKNDPNFGKSLVSIAGFGEPTDLVWVNKLAASDRANARTAFLKKSASWDDSVWNAGLIRFIADGNNTPEGSEKLRKLATREELLPIVLDLLSKRTSPDDYGLFLESLSSRDPGVRQSAWQGLSKLPVGEASKELVPLIALRTKLPSAFMPNIKDVEVEDRIIAVGRKLGKSLPKGGWKQWPLETLVVEAVGKEAWDELVQKLPKVNWSEQLRKSATLVGDRQRGEELFVKARCAACHKGLTALGPQLEGVSKRFSREDLFKAIYDPSRDVPDRYRALQVLTVDDQVYVGITVYDSVDGVILATANGDTVRIERAEIAQRRQADQSLMPEGLIDALDPQALADLEAYIKSL